MVRGELGLPVFRESHGSVVNQGIERRLPNDQPVVGNAPVGELLSCDVAPARICRCFAAEGAAARGIDPDDMPRGLDAPDALDIKGRMEWASAALSWMEKANIKGASITQPFKENFPLVLQTHGDFSLEEIISQHQYKGQGDSH